MGDRKNIRGFSYPDIDNKYWATWICYFGVAIKNESQLDSVYSLVFYLDIDLFDSFNVSGVEITEEDQRNYKTRAFHSELYKIYLDEILPKDN